MKLTYCDNIFYLRRQGIEKTQVLRAIEAVTI